METATATTTLPYIVNAPPGSASADLTALFHAERATWDTIAAESGAVLFRGFPVGTLAEFQAFTDSLRGTLDYVQGNSPRIRYSSSVFSSTEYPSQYFISLHNELSYCRSWPRHLFFCCMQAPSRDGETPIARSEAILGNLPGDLVARFRSKGVRYIRNLHGGRGAGPSWKTVFATESREEVEVRCRRDDVACVWGTGDSLRLTEVRPAIIRHRLTGREIWFNQADQFHPSGLPPGIREPVVEAYRGNEESLPQHATFGDGSPIADGDLETIRRTARAAAVFTPWEKGDLLFLDNETVCHGRNSFAGERKILVALA